MHVVAADPAPAEAPTLHEETVAGLPVSRLRGLRPPRRLARGRVAAGFRSLAAAQNFREVAERFCPHVVHIFHLSYLTADCLEVCAGLGLPVVMTVTDFWLVCPIARLQLADGRRCNGPSRRAGNCLKHLTEFRAAALAPVTLRAQFVGVVSEPPPFDSTVTVPGSGVPFGLM